MGNLAYDNVTPIRPDIKVVESRVANLDDGYTRLANELLEAVMCADLTARQLKVALAVIRKTYGFGKKLDRITNTQIAGMTGIHHTHVCTAKNEMIAMKIIISSGNQIGINKTVSDWNTNISQLSETLAESVNKTLANIANDHSPSQLNTKETIQNKEKKTTPNPLTGVVESVKVKTKKPKAQPVPCQAVLEAYNAVVGNRLPNAEVLSDKRKRAIKKLLSELKTPSVEAATAYFKAFLALARPFHFGDNDRGWQATFDYVIRVDTLTSVREETL